MPAIKFPTSRLSVLVCLGSVVVGIVIASCRLMQPASEHGYVTTATPTDHLKQVLMQPLYLQKANQSGTLIKFADFALSNCDSEAKDLMFSTQIRSAFGSHTLLFNSRLGTSGPVLEVEAGAQKFLIAHSQLQAHSQSTLSEVCQQLRSDDITVSETRMIEVFHDWLSAFAPDCQFDFEADQEWYCHLPMIEATLADHELEAILSTMIRRWNRQPYLLTRRLTVARQIASALSSGFEQSHLASVCRVIALALPEELPVIMSSPEWQQAVCSDSATNAHEAAKIGLTKALSEIEFVRQLFERTSHLGMLTIRIPRSQAPSRNIWVSLQPGTNVKENIARESAQLWTEMQLEGKPRTATVKAEERGPACWHPAFHSSPQAMTIAQHLDLVGSTVGAQCLPKLDTPLDFNPHHYLADSITSETEFLVTNGNAKLLRLPAGSYRYSLQGHNENLDEFEQDDFLDVSEGEINWGTRRPRALINTWTPSTNDDNLL